MNEFDRRIEAAAAYLSAGQPVEAANEIKSIDPDLRGRPEVLFIEYGISATREDWKQTRRLARILRRRYRNEPAMVLLLTEAMRNEEKLWEAGAILRAAEKRFPNATEIQHHLLRHEIEFDAPEVALRRIERLIRKEALVARRAFYGRGLWDQVNILGNEDHS